MLLRRSLTNRRMFLRGAAGSVLAAPWLPSLAPRAVAAPASPARYIQFLFPFGFYKRDDLVPPIKNATPERPAGVADCLYLDTNTDRVRSLIAAQPTASVFSPELLPYLTFVRGLVGFKANHEHNATFATTASFPRGGPRPPDMGTIPFPSIDWLLERSTALYGTSFDGARALRVMLNTNYKTYHYGSWSWAMNAQNQPVQLETAPSLDALWSSTFAKVTVAGSSPTPVDSTVGLHKRVTDYVLEDYRSTIGHRRISADDRQRLQQFMEVMSSLESSTSPQRAGCAKPSAPMSDPKYGVQHRRAIDLVVMALACDLTRVVSYQINQGGDSLGYNYNLMHAWSHGRTCEPQPCPSGDPAKPFRTMNAWMIGLADYFLKRLRETKDASGVPLIDSTLFYMASEFAGAGEGVNEANDVPVVLAGGANGRLRTGLVVDYVQRPYNNLLATLMYVLGSTYTDFERGTPGFGVYRRVVRDGAFYAFAAKTYDLYNGTAKQREALPLLMRQA